MRFLHFVLGLATVTSLALADEIKTVDGTVHTGKLKRIEPDGLMLETDAGIEKIPFDQLPKETQAKYGYNAAKAQEYKAAQANARAALQQQRDQVDAYNAQYHQAQADRQQVEAISKAESAALIAGINDQAALDASATSTQAATAPAPTNPLDARPEKKFSVYGKVIQRTPKGLLIDAQQRQGVSGYKQAEGTVWLTGADAREGETIRVQAIAAGTFTYTSLLGEHTVEAYAAQ